MSACSFSPSIIVTPSGSWAPLQRGNPLQPPEEPLSLLLLQAITLFCAGEPHSASSKAVSSYTYASFDDCDNSSWKYLGRIYSLPPLLSSFTLVQRGTSLSPSDRILSLHLLHISVSSMFILFTFATASACFCLFSLQLLEGWVYVYIWVKTNQSNLFIYKALFHQ